MMQKFRDLVGQRFGRLVAVALDKDKPIQTRSSSAQWVCRCDCGTVKTLLSQSLVNGNVVSCGCYSAEKAHGGKGSPEYRSWQAMKTRCLNSNSEDYPNYGGRGVKVCDSWVHDFPQFLHDMGPRPGMEYSLDRIDTNCDYKPSNCRWATPVEQSNNKRGNVLVTMRGETRTFTDWCRHLNLDYRTVKARVTLCQYSVEKAFGLATNRPFRGTN